ncbi:MAG: tRNA guanosine(15) transglycosylase TgtA [Candidatus Thermoplasmatota archaeon]|nr:tRNA guanosine(15) transglycosylase TgtA [Candidatus Thermoplasmatota archaeon]
MSDTEDLISSFEVRDPDLAGRLGTYTIKGKKVETPELMPVVNPNRMVRGAGVPPSELLENFGFRMIITNSYIIRRSEDINAEVLRKGIHGYLDYEGVVMTDSGTFQSYIYGGRTGGEVDVDPLEIVRYQNAIGSDVGTILDRFTVPDRDHEAAAEDLRITLDRARSSMEVNHNMELAVPIQGGRHTDLRTSSGKGVRDLGVGYAPIGGVVPLMENYEYSLLVDIIVSSKRGLGPSIPAHLFGAGHPMLLPLAVALGCDLFDSASYAKFAHDDRYMTRFRTLRIGEMLNLPCSCPVCATRGPEDILDMEKDDRAGLLSRHNLWVLREVLDEVRAAVKEGTLWEIVERSAMANPSMYSAVRRMREHTGYLEENAPRTLRRFMSSSGLSLARPEFLRLRERLSAFEPPESMKKALVLTDWTVSRSYRADRAMWKEHPEGIQPVIKTPLGAVPFDITDMYPISQSIFPPPGSLDAELESYMDSLYQPLIRRYDDVIEWDGRGDPPVAPGMNNYRDLDMRRARSILRMQFGKFGEKWADEVLFKDGGSISILTSRRTGKIRNIMETGPDGRKDHLLSMRAEDGHFNLRWLAAVRLHEASSPPLLRVEVEEGTGEFNAKGFNVFCKFVIDADKSIRAGDDVLVIGRNDELYAVGRANVSSGTMVNGRSGIAVKVRDGAVKRAG